MVLSDRRVTPDMAFEIIEQFRPTMFFGVPTLYAQQLLAMESAKPDLSSIRLCISAGEALPADVFRRWNETTGLTILVGLGSTEMLHIFVSNSEADLKPGSSGRVVPGYEVRLVDEAGEAVKPGDIGTVHVKGESAAKLYWKNPGKTAATMLGEWLNTGDMYYCDEEGFFHNCGRGDDMLKVGGLWCSPFEIEAKLIEHPKVLEAAVVGRADDDDLNQARMLHRPQQSQRRRRAAQGRFAAPLQGWPGRIQISALVQFRGRIAQDGHRQNPTVPVAR